MAPLAIRRRADFISTPHKSLPPVPIRKSRTHSTKHAWGHRLGETEVARRRQVYSILIERLQAQSIDVADFSQEMVTQLLPGPGGQEISELWTEFLEFPIYIPDSSLKRMFPLQQSDDTTEAPKEGTSIFYVRSFCLTIQEMLDVLGDWQDKGIRHEEDDSWKTMLEVEFNSTVSIYIRYIGTSSHVSAFKRHQDDLVKRTYGVYHDFISTLLRLSPHVVSDCQVFTFEAAKLPAFRKPDGTLLTLGRFFSDSREQVLIALFGKRTLLNRQPGGHYASYSSSPDSMHLFQSLGTNYLRRFANPTSIQPASAEIKQGVGQWAKSVIDFSKAHSKELGSDTMPLGDLHEQIWRDQAEPSAFDGQVLLAFLSVWIIWEDIVEPKALWQSKSRAIVMFKDFLSRLTAWETGQTQFHRGMIDALVNNGCLPWIDQQYWPRRDVRKKEASEIAREYLASTRPLIVVTPSQEATSLVFRNFTVLNTDIGEGDIADISGSMWLKYFTRRGSVTERRFAPPQAEFPTNDEDCFIHIPIVHPGADKYTSAPDSLREILDMTLWKIILALDVASKLVEAKLHQTRQDLCRAIMKEVEQRWPLECEIRLQRAKDDLNKYFTDVFNRSQGRREFYENFEGVTMHFAGTYTILNWKKPSGHCTRIKYAIGKTVQPKSDTEYRTIHFTAEGIDIRNENGNSMPYNTRRSITQNPTLPGRLIRARIEQSGGFAMTELWEHQTGLDFNDTFPLDTPLPDPACGRCALAGQACTGGRPCDQCQLAGKPCYERGEQAPVDDAVLQYQQPRPQYHLPFGTDDEVLDPSPQTATVTGGSSSSSIAPPVGDAGSRDVLRPRSNPRTYIDEDKMDLAPRPSSAARSSTPRPRPKPRTQAEKDEMALAPQPSSAARSSTPRPRPNPRTQVDKDGTESTSRPGSTAHSYDPRPRSTLRTQVDKDKTESTPRPGSAARSYTSRGSLPTHATEDKEKLTTQPDPAARSSFSRRKALSKDDALVIYEVQRPEVNLSQSVSDRMDLDDPPAPDPLASARRSSTLPRSFNALSRQLQAEGAPGYQMPRPKSRVLATIPEDKMDTTLHSTQTQSHGSLKRTESESGFKAPSGKRPKRPTSADPYHVGKPRCVNCRNVDSLCTIHPNVKDSCLECHIAKYQCLWDTDDLRHVLANDDNKLSRDPCGPCALRNQLCDGRRGDGKHCWNCRAIEEYGCFWPPLPAQIGGYHVPGKGLALSDIPVQPDSQRGRAAAAAAAAAAAKSKTSSGLAPAASQTTSAGLPATPRVKAGSTAGVKQVGTSGPSTIPSYAAPTSASAARVQTAGAGQGITTASSATPSTAQASASAAAGAVPAVKVCRTCEIYGRQCDGVKPGKGCGQCRRNHIFCLFN